LFLCILCPWSIEIPIVRKSVTYKPLYAKYILNTKNYVQQYNHMYVARLNQMRAMLRLDPFILFEGTISFSLLEYQCIDKWLPKNGVSILYYQR